MNVDNAAISSACNPEAIPEKPKRPLSAYNYFFQHERKLLLGPDFVEKEEGSERKRRVHRKTHGKYSFGDMARIIAQKWKQLGEDKRLQFEDMAVDDKKRYKQQMKIWKRCSKQEQLQCKRKTDKLQQHPEYTWQETTDTNIKKRQSKFNQGSSDMNNDAMANQAAASLLDTKISAQLKVAQDTQDEEEKTTQSMLHKLTLLQQMKDQRVGVSEKPESNIRSEAGLHKHLLEKIKKDASERIEAKLLPENIKGDSEELPGSTEANFRRLLYPEGNFPSVALAISELNRNVASSSATSTVAALSAFDSRSACIPHAWAGQSDEAHAAANLHVINAQRILEEKIRQAQMTELLRRQMLDFESQRAANMLERTVNTSERDPSAHLTNDNLPNLFGESSRTNMDSAQDVRAISMAARLSSSASPFPYSLLQSPPPDDMQKNS